ncbi:alpha/beta fold hydrolase [Brumimicrobium glaciale]|uniref:Alpha/beta fold hydrolase n=1 Tax=Brumimicrobium glaciale TaxID=200475 RepID=A0A4Q4KF70_9FLAO|nr:alpha/beta fold hydrolase [Brumimicrobium glaciale]RYM31358.1 alpha/beta fold hydrolase [Brumimicrobium glaciale]
MKLISLITLVFLLLSSCSFDSMFLYPTQIPAEAKNLTINTPTDTTIIYIDFINFQPTFRRPNNDIIDLSYTIESVKFESDNGNMLNGWMIKSKTQKAETTLLHFHGNAGFIIEQYRALSPLLDYGFQIFIIDYSGFGFSEGKATRKNVLMDGNSALKHLVSRPDIKNTNLVIYGQSLGGHLAAVVGEQNQDLVDGIVIEGAFSSHKDIGKETAGFFGKLFVQEQYSALESIQNFHKPVLIIHSSEDDVIPIALGRKIYDHANEPKEFYEIDGCHICGPRLYHEEIAEKIQKMIK